MTSRLAAIGFDADDTLWHNERFFRLTQDRFAELLADHAPREALDSRLLEAERRNLGRYGFGVKGFTLSMIETALEVTDGAVPNAVIAELLAAGREMLDHPIELLPHARESIQAIAGRFRLVLITKGDLLHQERKLAQSGLGDLFDGVEIVSAKTPEVYAGIFARHGCAPESAMMVGNSMKSDVRPVVDLGGWGVFVPHGLTWEIEHADPPATRDRYHELADLSALPTLIEEIG